VIAGGALLLLQGREKCRGRIAKVCKSPAQLIEIRAAFGMPGTVAQTCSVCVRLQADNSPKE
jgi:hypothetical protein